MSRRVVVLDYGSGNIRSAQRAIEAAGGEVEVSDSAADAVESDGLVVPGVGAFAACMRLLTSQGFDQVIRARTVAGRLTLGICVGHQVLFSGGDEHGETVAGLGIWPERVTRIDARVLPHVGWNTVSAPAGSAMFEGVSDQHFYFVHSYAVATPASRDTTATHESATFVAAREDGPVWGVQFHPEKSGDAGIALLRNWLAIL